MVSSRTCLLLVALNALSASVSALHLEGLLNKRDGTTAAQCSSEFVWANNEQNKSACRVLAEIIAPCHGGSWNIPALINNNDTYDRPEDSTVEDCSCSWAAYNLISACAACQGKVQAVRPWSAYSLNCHGSALTEDSYYPTGRIVNDATPIPFWATTNPETWAGRMWTVQEARSIYDQGHSDVLPGTVTKKKASSAGPIAGGVVGGLVAIVGAAAIVFFLVRRHRQKLAAVKARALGPVDHSGMHMRSPSDATDKSAMSTSYTHLSSTPGFPTGYTPTVRTHETSNYQYSAFGVPERVSMPATNNTYTVPTVTTPPLAHSRQISLNREEVITPFHLQSPSPDSSQDRKGSAPTYDSPNAPPNRAGDAMFDTPRRGRVNPPAYSPSPPPGDSVSVRGGPSHVKGNLSIASHETNNQGHHRNQHSASSAIETTLDATPLDAMSGVPDGTTIETEAGTAYPRDVKRRPTEDSFTARDLA